MHTLMSEAVRLVLSGNLSSKWRDLSQMLAPRRVAVTTYTGPPAEVLSHCRRLTPCVLVVPDCFFDQIDPDEFCRTVDFGRSIHVMVELQKDDPLKAEQLIRMGCAGLLSQEANSELALHALDSILDGELWLSRRMISSTLQKLLCEAKHHLTFRESQILSLLGEGLKNYEIAERLFISPQTVRWHLRSLYSKLGTHDRGHAAMRDAPLRKP